MTGQNLLESMEYVDSKLIEAAENPPHKKRYRKVYLMTRVAAACAVIVIGIAAYGINVNYIKNTEDAASGSADLEEKEEGAAVEGDTMNAEAFDEVMITMLDEELKVKAESDKTIKEIAFVMKDGSPAICLTITEEQANLIDQDELLSDSFDGDLVQYAAYLDERLVEYGFDEAVTGIVYIEGQASPYRFFTADEATTP